MFFALNVCTYSQIWQNKSKSVVVIVVAVVEKEIFINNI